MPTRTREVADVAHAAANLAAWHRSSVQALGWRPRRAGGWWTCPLPGPTIYHAAISLRPGARQRRLRALVDDADARYLSVCDSFADLDLTDLGLGVHQEGSWYQRPPGPPAGALPEPPDLRITAVADPDALAVFEATMAKAFEVAVLIGRFDVHAPGILDDVAMTSRLGFVGDEPVSVAMGYETAEVVGVYGVGTVPAWRGRGFATAMMRDLLAWVPTKPTILQPSERAKPLYRRLGFGEIGRFVHWV